MNYFGFASAAERYARGRRYFHPQAIDRVRELLQLEQPLDRALDVGCGTGLSTRALRAIATQVTGVDPSADMIAQAQGAPGIEYCVGAAEDLPFADAQFDLLTLAQVVHWLDHGRFFKEAHRVLRPQGWLAIYDNFFTAEAPALPQFQRWYREVFLGRFPTPARATPKFSAEDLRPHGFRLLHQERHRRTLDFTPAGLLDFLVSQSNVAAKVEIQGEDIEPVRAWLGAELQRLFGGEPRCAFEHEGPLWVLLRV